MSEPGQIDGWALARLALEILVEDLTGFGNELSDMHRGALHELLDAFAGYATGELSGRRAYPLPTGTGKTSAVVAFVAAAHRLGYRIPVSVAASRVEALCRLKQGLLAHGVPADWIGLKHSLPDAPEPSTGDTSHLVQLVTHARIRSGKDFELFGTHEGTARPLTVYDETLLRADSFALDARSLFAGAAALEASAYGTQDPLTGQLKAYLCDSVGRIRGALEDLSRRGDPYRNGTAVELGEIDAGMISAMVSHLGTFRRHLRGLEVDLRGLLEIAQDTLRVVVTEQGGGLVTAREVVPAALRNVVILDASAPIRELARLDPTITVVESFDPAALKSFERVEVRQLVSPGGRSSMEQSLCSERSEASALVREVAEIIRDGWESERAFLIFTFVPRGALDMAAELKSGLRRAGIDVDAVTPQGGHRLNWLPWGSEVGLNGLEECTSVILAGVLHRSHLDLAAAVRGQTGNLAEPTPSSRIRELIESEVASCVYQAASRGSCRRIDNGRAHAMRLHLIHKSAGIKTILDREMPGAVWSYPDPKHLRKSAAETRAARLLGQLLGYLRGLPPGIDKVSSRAVKSALALPDDNATRQAFSGAGALLELQTHGWALQGRSFVRGGAVYGFRAR